MAVIDINLKPSKGALKWFGLILLGFFGLIGGIVYWRADTLVAPTIIWSIGTALSVVFYAARPFRLPMYLGWMYATYPIGWVISHLCLGAVYFLVLTPIGLLMRLSGHDPLQRKLDPRTETYWTPHNPAGNSDRYFRQF